MQEAPPIRYNPYQYEYQQPVRQNDVYPTPHQRSPSKKAKILALSSIAVVLIILAALVIPSVVKSHNESQREEIVLNIAVMQIREQMFAQNETVYDLRIVDRDDYGHYIVTATTKPNAFETWWVVWVELASDNNRYRVAANFHGGGKSTNDWIDEYHTASRYRWGVPIEE